ncbi:MAG: large conductance mechanosensitive channel protein MscL [Planctomycetota bacterium]|jgi:large conductance mechanosensitive channel
MLKEFKKFALKGNMLDMAVGIIIGAAFGTVVKSLVSDVIMPPIGKLMGGVDFSNLYLNLSGEAFESYEKAKEAGAAVIGYGAFLNNVISFLIVAWAVFMLVKGFNKMKAKEEAAPPGPTMDQELLTEIRDLLKSQA